MNTPPNPTETASVAANTAPDSYRLNLSYPAVPFAHHTLLAELVWILPHLQTLEVQVDGDVGFEQPHGMSLFFDPACQTESPLPDAALLALLNDHNISGVQLGQLLPVARADWEHEWKQFWQPTRMGKHIIVCPSWETPDTQSGDIILTLDPGGAFGTGTHPTTRLMMEALERLAEIQDFGQLSLTDVGCGSGILAILAAKLGCNDIMALDVEHEAVAATQANAALNHVSHCITASDCPLEDRCLTPMDGMVMNIHWPILEPLIPECAARLAPGGWLLVSGLIDATVATCQSCLEAHGFEVTGTHTHNGWHLLEASQSV